MLTVSAITRRRSVKWLPSRRANAQAISISFTAYSFALRSVNVTSALEPRPPLRHVCEEIFRPSIGLSAEVVSGADVPADGAATGFVEVGSVVAAGVSTRDRFCA